MQVNGVLSEHASVLENDWSDGRLAAPVGKLLILLAWRAEGVEGRGPARIGLRPAVEPRKSPDWPARAKVAKVSKKPAEEAAHGYEGLLELRRLHVELDLAIRDAYGWQNLPLDHDFYEVETLAENDRVRYTISPAARKEVLRRLPELNHARAEAEKANAKPAKTKRGKKALSPNDEPVQMFAEES